MKSMIKIADNKDLETHSLFTRFIRVFTVPFLNHLPATFLQRLMRTTSHDARVVVENTGSALALEAMYTRYHRNLFERGILEGIADIFWHHCISQPKALRNRLKIVESLLQKEITERIQNTLDKEVSILNIGGGSSRSLMHSLLKLSEEKVHYDGKVKIINLDRDERAIDLGKKLAQKFKLHSYFEWITADARNIESLVRKESVDIVEMVGLFDYFSEGEGIEVTRQIYKVLKPGGTFIVANVYPNSEMPFVYRIGWPHMYYRDPDTMEKVLRKAGFEQPSIIIFEPLKVHIVALVKK